MDEDGDGAVDVLLVWRSGGMGGSMPEPLLLVDTGGVGMVEEVLRAEVDDSDELERLLEESLDELDEGGESTPAALLLVDSSGCSMLRRSLSCHDTAGEWPVRLAVVSSVSSRRALPARCPLNSCCICATLAAAPNSWYANVVSISRGKANSS